MTTIRAIGLAVVLVAGAFGVVLASVPSDLFDLERHVVPKELALHGAALAGILLLLPGRGTVRLGVVEGLLAAAVCWTAFSALTSTNHWLALRAAGVSVSAFAIFGIARAIRHERAARWVLLGITAAVFTGTLTGLAQAYGVRWEALATERPPGGTFGNRNFLAHFEVIGLPALLLLTFEARSRVGRWTGVVALGLTVGIVVLTRSRAAWLAGVASLGAATMLAFLRARTWRAALPARHGRIAGAAVALGIVGTILIPNRLEWRSRSPYSDSLRDLVNYREGSGRARVVQYGNSLALVAKDPVFGVGPGNWFVHYPRVATPGDPSYAGFDPIPTNPWPSSDWIAFLAERGPIGALLLALAGAAALVVAWRRAGSGDLALEGRALAATGVLVAALVAGLFDAVLLLPAPAYLVAALTGLLLPETRPVVTWEPQGRRRVARLVLPPVVLGLLVTSSLGQLAAIRLATRTATRATLEHATRYDPGNHRLRLRLASRGSCAERLPHARAARRLLPFHPAPRQLVARCDNRT
jgi:O-antigen ligase